MKKRLAIIGSGDLGQQIAHFAKIGGGYEVFGFYDDYTKKNEIIKGYPCIGKIEELLNHYQEQQFDEIIIGVGYKHLAFKESLYQQFVSKIPFATVIHPSAVIDVTAHIGKGVVIYPACVIDQHVRIGDNVLINLGCCIAHDTSIGDHSFLSPRVAIAGFVHTGKRNILGINATIIDNILTVDNVQIGGGGVVIKNIEKAGLFVGNPVKFIR